MNEASANTPKPRVLLVNPEKLWTHLVALNIQSEFDVVEARRPDQAFEILSSQSFSAVTAELLMSQMNGMEMVEEMHRRNIWTPAIITTAAVTRDQVDQIPPMPGIVAWLAHPCNLDEILAALRKAVAQGPKPEPAH